MTETKQQSAAEPAKASQTPETTKSDSTGSDTTGANSKAKPVKKTSKPTKPKSVSKTNLVVLLIALAAVGGTVWNYWLLQQQLQQQLKSIAGQSDSQAKLAAQMNRQADQLQINNDKLAEISALQNKTQTEQEIFKQSLESLRENLGQSTIAWKLAEIDYLLAEASYRLTISRDINTALAVYATADERIKSIGDPVLLKVRKAIADEMASLRAIETVDITGLSLKLASLANNVSNLPLIDKDRIIAAVQDEPEQKIESWLDIPKRIWEDLKTLVQVRRHQQPTEPLLAPQQSEFLYQNLQLKLEQARVALIRQDTKLFQHDIKQALGWINSFFDANSSSVRDFQMQLDEFAKVELVQDLSDGSQPLRILRSIEAELKQQPSSTGDAPA